MATSPAMSRRQLLAQAAAFGLGLGTRDSHARANQPRAVMAWMRDEKSWAGVWTPGQSTHGIALPARAHQLMVVPDHRGALTQALVLARRPGEYLMRMDIERGKALQWHTMEDDRYLGGHAVLSNKGNTFFTTETDGETGHGLIAERDLWSLEKIREFPSGGIGPHALLMAPDGTLYVANGGILNLPETGRRKLNIGRMDSYIARLSPSSGQILAQYRLEDHYLSLRHLAWAPDGTLGVALQAEHPLPNDRQRAPALAYLQADELRAAEWPAASTVAGWDGYAGDICWTQGRFWVSAPHAGGLTTWSASGELLETLALPGAGALAAANDKCLVAGDTEALFYGPSEQQSPLHFRSPVAWDNHASLLA